MTTPRTWAVLLVPMAMFIVKTMGELAVSVPDGAEMDTVGSGFTFTVIVADACVDVVPVVVPAPVVVPVLVLPLLVDWTPTVAVTVACAAVVIVVCAPPPVSVFTTALPRTPVEVEKLTGTPLSALPFTSTTLAVMVATPPLTDTGFGLAETLTRPTAADPTAIRTPPFAPVLAPPEVALMTAVPLLPPAMNETVTRPLASVTASAGSTRPSVVVKVTCVPL